MSSKSHQRVINVWVKKIVPTPWGVPLEIMGMMELYKRKKNYSLIQTLHKIFMQSNIS